MPSSVPLIWLPVIAWLLIYEAWAVVHSYGYTLSEAVWWIVGFFTVRSDWPYKGKNKHRSMPPAVRRAIWIGWVPALLLLLLGHLALGNLGAGWHWLLFMSPYPFNWLLLFTLGVLAGHFFWQRISTYELIDKDEWNEYMEYLKKHSGTAAFPNELLKAMIKRDRRYYEGKGFLGYRQ